MTCAFRRFLCGTAAAAMVEFALAMGIFFLMVVGILDFGYAAWERNSVESDAREGARYAMVRGNASGRTTSASDIQTYVRSKSSVGSSITVATTWDFSDKRPGSVVTVTVTHVRSGRLFLPDTVRSSSAMIVVY
jgi:Flp pilus assembly protein TadG